ncbi:hypothetical protein LSAT2_031597 [Lamellibrachia satsuma]|nr:hypothetical protein LSAT2_031597 [Lamellibrachia satsuma]
MRAHFDEFTPEGKHWADRTNKCVMRQLSKETASMDSCRDVSSLVRQAFHTCAAKEDICSTLWDNRQPLLAVMTEKSWLSIVQAAKHCPRQVVSRYIFWTLENLNI